MDQKHGMDGMDGPGMERPGSASLGPVYFNILHRTIPEAAGQEEAEEILAEFDFLHHYAQKIAATLGGGSVAKLVLKEDQSLLGFHLLGREEIRGYQCSRPYSWSESLGLFR